MMMKSTIKLGLAEDHGALRQGYVTLLKDYKNLDILFDVNNGKELLDILKIVRPNVLLLDLEMPVMSGKDVLESLRSKYSSIKVIIVSAYFTKPNITESFKLGVKAFLKKEHKIEKIVEVIQHISDGGVYIDNEVATILAEELSSLSSKHKLDLTEHQIKVLKLLCKGHTNKDAAEELGLTVSAIKYHRANIMLRTESKTFQDLVTYAMRNKLI